MITPSGVTRAKVRPVSCDDEGVLGVSGLAPDAASVAIGGFRRDESAKGDQKDACHQGKQSDYT